MIGRRPGRRFGGGAVQNYELVRNLVKLGYEVVSIPGLEGGASILRYVSLLKDHYDIVHLHSFQPSPVLASLISSRIFGSRAVVTFHSFAPPTWHHNFAMRNLMRISLKNYDAVPCISEYVRERVANFMGSSRTRICTIYNGVDTDYFNPQIDPKNLKENLGIDGKKVILFVGRLVSLKGVQYLLEAMPSVLKEAREDVVLVICGTGVKMKYLKEMTGKLDLSSNVIFAGFVPHQQLPNYYAISDICVVPSTFESLGSVILEAMSMKKPVIGSNVGGIPEIIKHDNNGLLVPPKDPSALSAAILRLFMDNGLRRRISSNGRLVVEEKFSWDKIAGQVSELYQQITES